MHTVNVKTQHPYPIFIGSGLLQEAGALLAPLLPGAKLAVVADDTVDALYGDVLERALNAAGFRTARHAFPHGEGAKSPGELLNLYSFFSRQQITRADAAVALGGGVTGDLCGFAAATWLRGIPYVQVPTTFLAAIDSSVGGKTAVNIPAGKNLVGAFWQPRAVLCDTDTLSTLPQEFFCDGVAEALKYGAIFDEPLFERIAGGGARGGLEEIIRRCVDLKRAVVEDDERDTGRRQLLNFGHTLGHAIERESRFAVSHGRAVGIGMAEITRRTEALGLTAPGAAARIEAALAAYHMPARWQGPLGDLLPAVSGDKKRHGGSISFVILDRIGASRLYPVAVDALKEFIR